MLKHTVCTISTLSHLFKSLALAHSIHTIDKEAEVKILLTDAETVPQSVNYDLGKVRCYTLKEVNKTKLGDAIIHRYRNKPDNLRWSLKPVFLNYLLETEKCEKVLYTDNDIYFYHDFQFLFDELEQHAVLLNPHWRICSPEQEQYWLETNFREGLYNAGFLGVNRNAVKVLDWWARCCLYRCERNFARGLFDDQKYLDLFPVLEESCKILSHKGCNVAYWNQQNCPRSVVDGKVLIDGRYPVVFIHFAKSTIQSFLRGEEPEMQPYFEDYLRVLQLYKTDYKPQQDLKVDVRAYLRLVKWKLFHFFR